MSALEGIRVIDLSRVLAGPYCAQLLAGLGAEVVKVEAPEGDMNRAFPMVLGPGESTNFLSVNRGKRGMTLNLKSPAGRDLLYRMAAKADVLIQSFLPRTARALGVDYETISEAAPDLIYTSVSGYGSEGPLADKPGFDMMVAAWAGVTGLTGEPDRPPVRPGVPAVDLSTGMLAFGATTTALLARERGAARGQRVDVSLLHSAVALLGFHAVNYTAAGVVDRREGAGYEALQPYDVFRAADGEILVGAPTEAQWVRLCEALDAPGLRGDPRYADNAARCRNREALRADLEALLAARPVAEWLALLEKAGLSCAPIHAIDRALDHEQVRANAMVTPATRADGTTVDLPEPPFRLSATPTDAGPAPPGLGEHTEPILRDWLDISAKEVARLREEGAF